MLDFKNPNKDMQEIIDHINSKAEERENILKNKKGCFYLEIIVPDLDMETFEKWQLGDETGDCGFTQMMTNCNGATLTVAHNVLRQAVREMEKNSPYLKFADMMNAIKSRMIIDEEDLGEDESKWKMED